MVQRVEKLPDIRICRCMQSLGDDEGAAGFKANRGLAALPESPPPSVRMIGCVGEDDLALRNAFRAPLHAK